MRGEEQKALSAFVSRGPALGSERFLGRLRELAGPVVCDPPAPEARQFAKRDAEAIFRAVSEHDGLDRSALGQRGDPHIARAVAAWLCRRHSEVPLRELAPRLGLSRADSVPNLTRPFRLRPMRPQASRREKSSKST